MVRCWCGLLWPSEHPHRLEEGNGRYPVAVRMPYETYRREMREQGLKP